MANCDQISRLTRVSLNLLKLSLIKILFISNEVASTTIALLNPNIFHLNVHLIMTPNLKPHPNRYILDGTWTYEYMKNSIPDENMKSIDGTISQSSKPITIVMSYSRSSNYRLTSSKVFPVQIYLYITNTEQNMSSPQSQQSQQSLKKNIFA